MDDQILVREVVNVDLWKVSRVECARIVGISHSEADCMTIGAQSSGGCVQLQQKRGK